MAYEVWKRIKDMAGNSPRAMRKSLDEIIGDNPNHKVVPITKLMVRDFVSRIGTA
jgi:hypothetical protein